MWTKIGYKDYVLHEKDGYKLRVERLQKKLWWWALYKDDSLVTMSTDLDCHLSSRKEAFAAVLAVYRYVLTLS